MKTMRSHQRLLIFLLLVLALTCVISPWMAAGADWLASNWPNVQSERYPFSRVFNRAFMFSGIILFFACRRFLRLGKISELGLAKQPKSGSDVIIGWCLAVGSMIALASVMSVAGVFTPYFRLSLSESVSRCGEALFAGLFVGLLEEIFFRGILFKGLLEHGTAIRAFVLANLFYSAIHFVKPGERYFLHGLDPLAGFRHLVSTFAPFLDPVSLLPGFTGLFLIGVILSYTYMRTASLYFAIGLHAGWIFGLKTIRVFGDYSRQDLGWTFGSADPKIVSGVAAWVGLFIVGILVHILTRDRLRVWSGATKQVKVEAQVHGIQP
jgi:membrane protease YdiL (CAAX protease family)